MRSGIAPTDAHSGCCSDAAAATMHASTYPRSDALPFHAVAMFWSGFFLIDCGGAPKEVFFSLLKTSGRGETAVRLPLQTRLMSLAHTSGTGNDSSIKANSLSITACASIA